MATKAKTGAKVDGSVDDFMRAMEHPMKKEIEAMRQLILSADPSITEGIKWNGPSFMTSDWFATLNNPNNPRTQDHVALILHTGVKAKGLVLKGAIADREALLKWITVDRCMVTFANAAALDAKGPALQAIIKQWIMYL
jgi:Domain of unknown function (DU1801)